MREKGCFITMAAVCAFCILAVFPAMAGDQVLQSVEVIGYSRIFSGKVPGAREHARNDAFDAAVTRVAVDMAGPETMRKQFPLLCGSVLDKAQAYVQGFQILSESIQADKLHILARVTVNGAAVRKALLGAGLLTQRQRKPSLLYLFSQTNDSQTSNWWRSDEAGALLPEISRILKNKMLQKGFPTASPDMSVLGANQALEPEPGTLLAIGRASGADIVVEGKAEAKAAGNVMGTDMQSFRANVYARAWCVDNGAKVAEVTSQATALSKDPTDGEARAVARAASLAADDLAEKISAAWRKAPAGLRTLVVRVRNILPLANLVKFRKVLQKEISGVKRVSTRSMTDREAVLEVLYERNAQDLARDLLLHSYGSFGIRVQPVTGDTIDVSIAEK